MHKEMTRIGALLAGVLTLTVSAAAQQQHKKPRITSIDAAVTFSLEHSQVAQVNGNSVWLKGASADASATFYKGLGLAANFTGAHTANIQNNVSFSKVSFMAGPRYTYNLSRYMDGHAGLHRKKRDTQIFGELLVGGTHAFDSLFPGNNGVATTAGAFSLQLGGGADIAIAKGFGVRLFELDYVHTNLPNNSANSQNDFRLGFGVSYRH